MKPSMFLVEVNTCIPTGAIFGLLTNLVRVNLIVIYHVLPSAISISNTVIIIISRAFTAVLLLNIDDFIKSDAMCNLQEIYSLSKNFVRLKCLIFEMNFVWNLYASFCSKEIYQRKIFCEERKEAIHTFSLLFLFYKKMEWKLEIILNCNCFSSSFLHVSWMQCNKDKYRHDDCNDDSYS